MSNPPPPSPNPRDEVDVDAMDEEEQLAYALRLSVEAESNTRPVSQTPIPDRSRPRRQDVAVNTESNGSTGPTGSAPNRRGDPPGNASNRGDGPNRDDGPNRGDAEDSSNRSNGNGGDSSNRGSSSISSLSTPPIRRPSQFRPAMDTSSDSNHSWTPPSPWTRHRIIPPRTSKRQEGSSTGSASKEDSKKSPEDAKEETKEDAKEDPEEVKEEEEPPEESKEEEEHPSGSGVSQGVLGTVPSVRGTTSTAETATEFIGHDFQLPIAAAGIPTVSTTPHNPRGNSIIK